MSLSTKDFWVFRWLFLAPSPFQLTRLVKSHVEDDRVTALKDLGEELPPSLHSHQRNQLSKKCIFLSSGLFVGHLACYNTKTYDLCSR